MPEPVPDEPIDISGRPFLTELRTRSRPAAASGSAHLYAAVTGIDLDTVTAEPDAFPPFSSDPEPQPAQRSPAAGRPANARADAPSDGLPILSTGDRSPLTVGDDIDWVLVRKMVLALDVAPSRSRGGFDVAIAPAEPETDDERQASQQIVAAVERHVNQLVLKRGEASDWSDAARAAHTQAVFDAAFRYGRLSALLREDVENIDVLGYDTVWVTLPDGRREQRAPIADSDEGLEQLIADIAADRGRPFARPHGTVRLDIGGARFTALGGPQIIPRPRLAIRKHRLVDIDLHGLVASGMLSGPMAAFLTATMRAFRSHLVSGYAGAGKSTFLRALAAALPADEPIVTIETERELYLDKVPDRHRIVDPLQYLPDVHRGDDRDAVFPLDAAIEYALRLNAQVILFGEILGPAEAASAIKALQAGKGASSTIHAESAMDAIQRLSTALTQAGGMSDDAVPQQQIMHALDFVIQLELLPATADQPQRRIVSEIAEVIPGDAPYGRMQRPITRRLYWWNPATGRHEADEQPSPNLMDRLQRAGLTPDTAAMDRS